MRSKTGIFGLLVILSLSVCPFSSAYADVVNASGFIDELAAAAGMTSGDFIATTTGVVAVGAGMNIAKEQGIQMGQSASHNLENLVDAADYPDWSTLSENRKSYYQNSKENYDAAKFNSLLTAFGLGDAANRYYGFTSSGGADWEADWTETELEKINQLSEIGKRWAQGLPNTVNDVYETLTNRSYLSSYFPPESYVYNKSDNDSSWPTGLSTSINYIKGNAFTGIFPNGANAFGKSSNVVNILYLKDSHMDTVVWFDVASFSAWISSNSNFDTTGYDASTVTLSGDTFYLKQYATSGFRAVNLTACPPGIQLDKNQLNYVLHAILYGESETVGGIPEIEEYPEDIQAEANVDTYYPEQGVVKNIGWPKFLIVRQPVIPETGDISQVIALLKKISTDIGLLDRTSEDLSDLENAVNRFQFYANNILKVHDEGVFESLTDIGTQLETIIAKIGIPSNTDELIGDFHWGPFKTKSEELGEELENLAPFGAIFLVSGMVETISSIAVISKPELHIPFKFADQFGLTNDDIVIDVSWIDNAKPLINALMIFVLIMTLAGVSIKFIEIEVG